MVNAIFHMRAKCLRLALKGEYLTEIEVVLRLTLRLSFFGRMLSHAANFCIFSVMECSIAEA